ncbi:MAG: molybdopterin molybdotransferase MoeA [Halobacteriales archaeon]|nr:molybdopterin molybdotransferase MoeA [Halobacteriales archaeon]
MPEYDELLTRRDAVGRVLDLRQETLDDRPTESVELDAIAGRTLAEPIIAEEDMPPYDYATMDGFAFDATEGYPLTVVDTEVFPEDDPPSIDAGEAIRIATGAPLPPSANAVLKREEATVDNGILTGTELDPGTYTYERGSNVSAGETLFEAGEQLSPKDAILLRDLGIESVPVRSRLSVGVLATGTEIHEGRSSDLDSPMLMGLVRSWGHEPTFAGSVPDEYERVETRIGKLADRHDVVMTTGGTSVGKKDYTIRALDALGEVLFHSVRLRPGKPMAVAHLSEHDAVVFAIPGKPVGAHTITSTITGPYFTGSATLPTEPATLARDVGIPTEGFEYAIPVTLKPDEDDETPPTAMPLGHVDSPLEIYESVFDASVVSQSTRATRADGVVLTETAIEAGDRVAVVPYPVLE